MKRLWVAIAIVVIQEVAQRIIEQLEDDESETKSLKPKNEEDAASGRF